MSEPRLEPDELSTIRNLVNSEDWRAYRNLLEEHKDYLNQQALLELDGRAFEEAFAYRLRAVEANAVLRLIDSRLAELKKTEEE